jgi:hypothetical protein
MPGTTTQCFDCNKIHNIITITTNDLFNIYERFLNKDSISSRISNTADNIFQERNICLPQGEILPREANKCTYRIRMSVIQERSTLSTQRRPVYQTYDIISNLQYILSFKRETCVLPQGENILGIRTFRNSFQCL